MSHASAAYVLLMFWPFLQLGNIARCDVDMYEITCQTRLQNSGQLPQAILQGCCMPGKHQPVDKAAAAKMWRAIHHTHHVLASDPQCQLWRQPVVSKWQPGRLMPKPCSVFKAALPQYPAHWASMLVIYTATRMLIVVKQGTVTRMWCAPLMKWFCLWPLVGSACDIHE